MRNEDVQAVQPVQAEGAPAVSPASARQPWQEPKLAFVEPKLTKHGKLEKVTGFLGSFNP